MRVINPQTKELLDKLNRQALSPAYANSGRYRIMLSLAYGSDQRGELQAHNRRSLVPVIVENVT
mgnify:CR=1 FL=1